MKKHKPSTARRYILSVLTDATYGCIKDYKEIDAVGHRVVHGGEEFASSVLINQDVGIFLS